MLQPKIIKANKTKKNNREKLIKDANKRMHTVEQVESIKEIYNGNCIEFFFFKKNN